MRGSAPTLFIFSRRSPICKHVVGSARCLPRSAIRRTCSPSLRARRERPRRRAAPGAGSHRALSRVPNRCVARQGPAGRLAEVGKGTQAPQHRW
jgi:hypothetical protein